MTGYTRRYFAEGEEARLLNAMEDVRNLIYWDALMHPEADVSPLVKRVQAIRNEIAEGYYPMILGMVRKHPMLCSPQGANHQEDAIQWGMMGLLKAIRVYDRRYGTKLSTIVYIYAWNRITQEFRRVVWDAALIPVGNGDKRKVVLETDMAVASDDFSPDQQSFAFEAPDFDPSESLANQDAAMSVESMLSDLGDRHRYIIEARFGLNGHPVTTLESLGRHLGVTKERVRQLQTQAIKTLKRKHCRQWEAVAS